MGRPANHDAVESWHFLDVRRFAREGYFNKSRRFSWQWQRNGETIASITIKVVSSAEVRLQYTLTRSGEPKLFDYPIRLSHTYCHFGGERVWFHCPNCQRRVAKLHGPNVIFACRRCMHLNYRSQQFAKRDRLFERAWSLHLAINSPYGPLDCAAEFIQKPKWTRWATFEKLIAKMSQADEAACAEVEALMGIKI